MSLKYALKKIGVSLLTVLAVIILTFIVLRLMPGDIYDQMARSEAAQSGISFEEARERLVLRFNYDPNEPIYQQLVRYLKGLTRGDLGVSMINPKNTVTAILANALPWTLFSVSIALVISFLIGVQLGAVMAVKRKGFINGLITFYVTIVSTIPSYVIAIFLSIIFVFYLGWFPMSGVHSLNVNPGFNLPFIGSALWYAVMPIATYVISTTGAWILQMKGTSIATLGSDYVFAARARGLTDQTIMRRYMKRNAMIPLVTTLAMSFGGMIGGSTLIEGQFRYLGMGTYLSKALGERDFILYQGLLIYISISVIIANLIADLLYAKLDPRVRME